MFDQDGNPTDDADRMVYGCDDTLDPGDDSDPMYSDDSGCWEDMDEQIVPRGPVSGNPDGLWGYGPHFDRDHYNG